MYGVPSAIHSMGVVLQKQRHLHQLFFGLLVGVMLVCWLPASNYSNLGVLAVLSGTLEPSHEELCK